MIKEKRFRAIGDRASQGIQASIILCEIILEKYIADILPESRQISMTELNKITIYNYCKLKKYMGNNYYSVGIKTFNIIADNQYLAEQSKDLCKRYILKLVVPAHFDKDSFESRVGKFIMDIDFTTDERNFIDLMLNEFMSIANIKEFPHPIDLKDLCDFYELNRQGFYFSAKRVYNDILQKKLHAGDNLMPYLAENLSVCSIPDWLDKAKKFDTFYDENGFLKCDLDTNKDILIKNFINSVIFSFCDSHSTVALLRKLNAKYPILLSEKIFNEFNQ